MTKQETVDAIIKAGSVIITTVLSFIITPPVIHAKDVIIKWENVFVFFAGIFSIFFYDWIKNKARPKNLGFILAGALILLIITYEIMVMRFSAVCFSDRVIVSDARVKTTVQPKLDYWLKYSNNDKSKAYTNLVKGYQCSSDEIWDINLLYPRYYGIILIYLLIIISVTIILILIGGLIVQT